jgi:endonuclease/exonuclease/phosphatase family metal-dependent hydrolase
VAARPSDPVLFTLPIVLLVVVVIAVVVRLDRDDARHGDAASDVPSASLTVPSATPADRGTPDSAGTPPGAPPSTPPSATSSVCVHDDKTSRLTVLTFNIHSARAGDGSVHLSTIADELRRWRADVVLLQEVDRGRAWTGRVDMPSVLAKALGASWTFGANVRRSATNEYGTAILSRFPIVASRNVSLPAPPGTQQRGLLAATIDVDGTRVSVYDTHLENTSSRARLLQMRAITRVLAADRRPMVLGGDLNSRPGSPVLHLATQQLRDTWRAVGVGPGYTHSRLSPRTRIDYLLHSDGRDADLEPVAASVLRSGVSDHWAVRAGYRLVSRSGEICVPVLGSGDLP